MRGIKEGIWAVSRGEQTKRGWRTMRDFMRELVVGYIYAWKVGALECKTKKTEKKGILCGDIGRNESTSI